MTPLLFLPLFFCILASWFDLRLRRIPDALNASFFAIAIALALALGADMVLFGAFAGLAFLFAYALYRLGVWAGGDAKFYACLLAFYPLFKNSDPLAIPAIFLAAVLLFALSLLFSKRNELMANGRRLPFAAKMLLRRTVPVSELREGMVPAESVYVDNGKARIAEEGLWAKAKGVALGKKPEGRIVADAFSARGLTRSEIVELKKLKGVRVLQIRETAAFAPLVSLGFFGMVLFA